MKLNGWQRIWIVCGIIIFVIVTIVTIAVLPKRSEITSRWVYETINSVKKPNEYAYEIRDAYKDYDDIQLIAKIHEKYAKSGDIFDKVNFEEIDKRYKAELDGLFAKQIKCILIGLAIYIGLMLVMYGFGWSIGWIYRGFKRI
jgi:hypothetical protein